jgi:hypothetical protein
MHFSTRFAGVWKSAPALALAVTTAAPALAQAPAGTVEPILRVEYQQPAEQAPADQPAAQVATRVIPTADPVSPFDLTQQPGEHPLMPALRSAEECLKHIDANIKDYQAILLKRERINGELMDQEVAYIQFRHNPFSVHLFFLSPNKGRECLYVEGPNGTDGNLLGRDGQGIKRRLGVIKLDPNGRFAMEGQKYPITKIGIRNLASELVAVAQNDAQFGECEVTTTQTVLGPKDGEKRPVTLITVIHPTPRKNFRFYKAEVYLDNELKIPIRYAAYMWPQNPGEAPPLEEEYTYLNLQVNNGFTDATFDREQNPELFKN